MLIQSYDLRAHLYADGTQTYGQSDCFTAVADWMSCNRLQLKTEIICCTSSWFTSEYLSKQLQRVYDVDICHDYDHRQLLR